MAEFTIDTETGAVYFLVGYLENAEPTRPVREVFAEATAELLRLGYDWTSGPVESEA